MAKNYSWGNKNEGKTKVFAGSSYYVCRVKHSDSNYQNVWIPGYASVNENVCNYSFGYEGLSSTNFEVLYV